MEQQTLYEPRDPRSKRLILTSKGIEEEPRLQEEYLKIGSFNSLDAKDFRMQDSKNPSYIPIRLIGSLEQPSKEIREGLVKLLNQIKGLGIDPAIATDYFLLKQLLENELISGNAYLLKFEPTNKKAKKLSKRNNLCEIYVSSINDPSPRLKGKKVMQGSDEIKLLGSKIENLNQDKSLEGTLSLNPLGNITNAHRVNLSPFKIQNKFVSLLHPARVILLE